MKAIVTGAVNATEEELCALRSMGLEITLHPDERQAVEHPEQYEAVLCNGLFCTTTYPGLPACGIFS